MNKAHWYAIYTKRLKEHQVENKLLRLDLETYLPFVYTKVRRVYALRPLFPGYLFARFDSEKWYHIVRFVSGVNQVVSVDGKPVPIDPAIISELKKMTGSTGFISIPEQPAIGEQVRIQQGIWSGFVGCIERVRPRDRVVILLRTILPQTRIEIDWDHVEIL